MVLAAGLGTRMRPLTDRIPKPLVPVSGKPLIDHVLDRLADAGVARAVVNVHYMAEQIEQHLAYRTRPQIVISDERGLLLGTGGGVARALPQLGQAPFFHINSDTIWIDGVQPNLARLAETFDPDTMDALLLLAPTAGSIGYAGRGDFAMAADGRLQQAPRAGGGAVCLCRRCNSFARAVYRRAIRATSRLRRYSIARPRPAACTACGWRALWMHVGTPEAIAAAEAAIRASTELNGRTL